MKKCLFILLALILLFPTPTPVPAQANDSQTITVFAASSLTDAFGEIGAAFEAEHPGVKVVFNFGSSSSLAAQISEGAPADVFASANQKQMDAVLTAGTPQIFARNHLALIIPSDNPAGIKSLDDIAKPGILLVLAAPSVPVRDYTDKMLDKLAADKGKDFKQAILDNVVSEEDNVRQVVAKVALGEADAGIVYQSDVTPDIASDIHLIQIPDTYNLTADYPIALITDSPLAQEFVDFVLSDAGQDVLVHWGFLSVRPTTPLIQTPEDLRHWLIW